MTYIRKFLHAVYKFIGHLVCKILLIWWTFRDFCFPPTSDCILFVAHPDDDVLFFHKFIKDHHPYVCLVTTGWSLRRLPCFIKTMSQYGVTYRCYDFETNDIRTDMIEKRIDRVLRTGKFEYVATHSRAGEYGHEMHARLFQCVRNVYKGNLLVPDDISEISKYPLTTDLIQEKEAIFKNNYSSEMFVLDLYKVWVEHEHLTIIRRDL